MGKFFAVPPLVLTIGLAVVATEQGKSPQTTRGEKLNGEKEAQAKAEEAQKQIELNRRFYEARSKLGKRVNGVFLQAKVNVVHGDEKPDDIQVQWTLDYTGPRQPLTILKPTIDLPTSGQTVGIFYAEGKNKKVYEFRLESEPYIASPPIPRFQKAMFVTVEKGKVASGVTTLSARKVAEHYFKHWSEQFRGAPIVLHLQFQHKPYARGEDFDLDAWTGELHTEVMKVPIRRW